MKDLLNLICDFPMNPMVWLTLLFSVFSTCISIRLAAELSGALETIGIFINKREEKKWRSLFTTLLGTIFVVFVFLHFVFRLYP